MEKIARVMAVHRDRFELCLEDETIYARLKKSEFIAKGKTKTYPTVGDFVEISRNKHGDSWLMNVCSRKSVFCRLNAAWGMPSQVVAANFDYVFIMTSLNEDFNLSKLERDLIVTYESGAQPIILLNIILGGGMIIDTPGISKLMVSEVDTGIKCAFEDIEELISKCKFSDCKHQKEPGCAV